MLFLDPILADAIPEPSILFTTVRTSHGGPIVEIVPFSRPLPELRLKLLSAYQELPEVAVTEKSQDKIHDIGNRVCAESAEQSRRYSIRFRAELSENRRELHP